MRDLSLKEAVNEYISQLEDLSSSTITGYKNMLNKFAENFESVKDIDYDAVYSYLQVNYGSAKVATYIREYSVLKCFFEYLAAEGYIPKVPIKKRWRKKRAEHLPKYLDRTEVADLMVVVDKLEIRDRTIITFLFDSGVRRQELCDLEIKDLDLVNRTAEVTGKGNKKRTVHYTHKCKLLLERLISEAPPSQQAVFTNFRGRKIGATTIYHIAITLGIYIGLPRNLTPHVFRHTMATWLLNSGVDINIIATLLGHSKLETTELYARLMEDDLRLKYHKLIG